MAQRVVHVVPAPMRMSKCFSSIPRVAMVRMIVLLSMATPVPQLFERLRTGDNSALSELTPVLYEELHKIASRHLRAERANHTLQATALANEAYLKLFGSQGRQFADRVHFLAVASRAIRQVLVDYARSRRRQKRSSGARDVTWTANLEVEIDSG